MLWLNRIPITGLVQLKTDYDANVILLANKSSIADATASALLTAALKVDNVPYGYANAATDAGAVKTAMATSLGTTGNDKKFALGMALHAYKVDYKPETRRITYTATQLTKYRAAGDKFSTQLALLKATAKHQVTKNEKTNDADVS